MMMNGENAWIYMVGVLGGAYDDDAFASELIAESIAKSVGKITGSRVHTMMLTNEADNDD
jgi:hypothetical protein